MGARSLAAAAVVLAASTISLGAAGTGPRWWPEQRLTSTPSDSLTAFNFSRNVAAEGRTVHVVWFDGPGRSPDADPVGDGVFYRRSIDGGSRFEPAVQLSPVGAYAGHPSVAVSGSTVYVAYHELRRGKLDIRLRRSPDGGATWEPSRGVTDSGSAAHCSLAAWGDALYLVWGDTRSGNAEVYFRRSLDRGVTWGPERLISTVSYESWVGTVAASGSLVVVGWVDSRSAHPETCP